MAGTDVKAQGSGWASFATLIFTAGAIFNLIAGVAALAAKDKFEHDALLYDNLKLAATFWLILGGLQLISALMIHRRSPSGRILGVFVALLGASLWFFFLDARPWWAVIMITMYVMIMYTLTKYREVFERDSSLPDENLPLQDIAQGVGKQL